VVVRGVRGKKFHIPAKGSILKNAPKSVGSCQIFGARSDLFLSFIVSREFAKQRSFENEEFPYEAKFYKNESYFFSSCLGDLCEIVVWKKP